MCLVHKQAVNAEFLKADDIVFSRLVVELLSFASSCFRAAFISCLTVMRSPR